LACVVLEAIFRLIKTGIIEFMFLYRVSRLELIEFVIAFIVPLFAGLEIGIVVGMISSVIILIVTYAQAQVIELGAIQTKNGIEYVNPQRFQDAKCIPGISVIELRAELSFINYRRLTHKVSKLISQGIKCIVISLSHTSRIDTTGLRQVIQTIKDAKNTVICISHCKAPVRDIIKRYKTIVDPKFNIIYFVSTHDAVTYCQGIIARENLNSPLNRIKHRKSYDIRLLNTPSLEAVISPKRQRVKENNNDYHISISSSSSEVPPLNSTFSFENHLLQINMNDNNNKDTSKIN